MEKFIEHFYTGNTSFPINEYPEVCPRCERPNTPPKMLFTEPHYQDPDDGIGVMLEIVFKCCHEDCNRIFVGVYTGERDYESPLELYELLPPRYLADLVGDSRIPPDVLKDLTEASSCLKSKTYHAFGTAARRAVQSICVDRGATAADSLSNQIKHVEISKAFHSDVIERMHELRVLGNSGAHPNLENVTADIAEHGMKHLVWLVRTIYQKAQDKAWRNTFKKK